MSSAHKKVIVRRLTNETLPGYLPLAGFVRNHTVDLLDLSGRVIPLALNDIKHICYVRDFNLNDTANPERLTRRTFLAKPRTEGLWLRLTFRSGDLLEGLAPIGRGVDADGRDLDRPSPQVAEISISPSGVSLRPPPAASASING